MFCCLQARVLLFNCMHALWPKDYQIESLRRSHRIRSYLKQSKIVILPQHSNLQPMNYCSIALPLDLMRILIADSVAFFYASALGFFFGHLSVIDRFFCAMTEIFLVCSVIMTENFFTTANTIFAGL